MGYLKSAGKKSIWQYHENDTKIVYLVQISASVHHELWSLIPTVSRSECLQKQVKESSYPLSFFYFLLIHFSQWSKRKIDLKCLANPHKKSQTKIQTSIKCSLMYFLDLFYKICLMFAMLFTGKCRCTILSNYCTLASLINASWRLTALPYM